MVAPPNRPRWRTEAEPRHLAAPGIVAEPRMKTRSEVALANVEEVAVEDEPTLTLMTTRPRAWARPTKEAARQRRARAKVTRPTRRTRPFVQDGPNKCQAGIDHQRQASGCSGLGFNGCRMSLRHPWMVPGIFLARKVIRLQASPQELMQRLHHLEHRRWNTPMEQLER